MEKNDRSKRPKVSKKTSRKEKGKEEMRPSGPHWKEVFAEMTRRIFMESRGLG